MLLALFKIRISLMLLLSSDPRNNHSTLKRLVAKISQADNCSAKIFIGGYLEFKLNLANKRGRIGK